MTKINITANGKGRFYNNHPSVTTVLPDPPCPANMTPTQWEAMLNKAARFGTICHEGCAQIAEGEEPCIEAAEADAEKIGKLLTSYWKWFLENVKEVIAVEESFINEQHGFGGTIDLIAILNNDDTPTIIDIKTSSKIYPITELQLAAYGLLTREAYSLKVVRLKKESPDKPPQVKEYPPNQEAIQAFLGLLDYYKFIGGKNGK